MIDLLKFDAVAILGQYATRYGPFPRRWGREQPWHHIKLLQRVSPEVIAEGSVYKQGDILVPYWIVRPPSHLNFVLVEISAGWKRWKCGGYLGSFAERPDEQPGTEVISTADLYIISKHARGHIALRGFAGLQNLEPIFDIVAPKRRLYDVGLRLSAVHNEWRGNGFWSLKFEESDFPGIARIRYEAKMLSVYPDERRPPAPPDDVGGLAKKGL